MKKFFRDLLIFGAGALAGAVAGAALVEMNEKEKEDGKKHECGGCNGLGSCFDKDWNDFGTPYNHESEFFDGSELFSSVEFDDLNRNPKKKDRFGGIKDKAKKSATRYFMVDRNRNKDKTDEFNEKFGKANNFNLGDLEDMDSADIDAMLGKTGNRSTVFDSLRECGIMTDDADTSDNSEKADGLDCDPTFDEGIEIEEDNTDYEGKRFTEDTEKQEEQKGQEGQE